MSEFAQTGGRLIFNPPDAAKMSEALFALVEPEWDSCPDREAMRQLLILGVAAWNAAVMKGTARSDFLEGLAERFPSELREHYLKEVIEPLIRRKEKMFPHIHRPILSFELTWPSGEPYLTVLSGLAEQRPGPERPRT